MLTILFQPFNIGFSFNYVKDKRHCVNGINCMNKNIHQKSLLLQK